MTALVVVVTGAKTQSDLDDAQSKFEQAALLTLKSHQCCGMFLNKLTQRLGPAVQLALKAAISAVEDAIASLESNLVTNFGQLCDAVAKRCIEQFDASAGAELMLTPCDRGCVCDNNKRERK
eukprot:2178995-Ditylum_brightwellii.AAC.1